MISAGAPLVLVALIVAGYYFTSVRLSGRLIDTFYLALLVILIDATAVRGLAVAAQWLAYKRAVAEREAEPKENVEGVEVEEPQMDLQQVNQQSLRLSKLILFLGFSLQDPNFSEVAGEVRRARRESSSDGGSGDSEPFGTLLL